jgi:Ca-activated chloride channel family protein
MSFGHPLLLLTLLAVPAAAALYLWLERRPARYALTFTNLDVLASVVERRSLRRHLPLAAFLLALAALCVALARPHERTLVASKRSTVILVLDVSGSMQARDVKPTRLGAAEEAVRAFLKEVPKSVRVGLIAFAGEPQVASPPTTDHALVLQALNTLDLYSGFGGTAIGDALAAAVELAGPPRSAGAQTIAFRTVARRKSPDSILFLSDGHQTRGVLDPLDGARRAAQAGIPVYTIALGTPNGVITRQFGFGGGPTSIPVPPDPQTLSEIAKITGGEFFDARSSKALAAAYRSLGAQLGREPGKREVTYEFLLVGAGLLVAAGVLSALVSPRLP